MGFNCINRSTMFVRLFLNINKNIFFDRFSFLKSIFHEKGMNILYICKFFLSNYILKYLLAFILPLFGVRVEISILLILSSVIFLLLKIDSVNWKLFYRKDICVAEPDQRKRFVWVLLGNAILDLFVQQNIVLDIVIIVFLLKFNIWFGLILFMLCILLYFVVILTYFILYTSSILFKKIYSFISYCISILVTTFFIYSFISFIIELTVGFSNRGKKFDFISFILNSMYSIESFMIQTIKDYGLYSTLILIFALAIYVISIKKGLKKGISNTIAETVTYDFFISDKIYKLTDNLFLKNKDQNIIQKYMEKDIQLIKSMYNYLFKNYLYVYFIDRVCVVLFVCVMLLKRYPTQNNYMILIPLSSFIMLLEAGSVINKKMVAIFSFCCDFNTLRVINSIGESIEKLLSAKIILFYRTKLLSFLLYIFLFIEAALFLKASVLFILLLIINIIMWLVMVPSMLIANNLIFTRANYKDFEKYLDESRIIEQGVSDFIPISILTNIVGMAIFASIIFSYVIKVSHSFDMIVCVVFVFVLSIMLLICCRIMRKIKSNIIDNISRGDYSADFKKIFNNY